MALAPKLILLANGLVSPLGLTSPSSTAFSSRFDADELIEDTEPRRKAAIPLVADPEMLIARALCAAATLGPGYGGGADLPVNNSVSVVPGEKEALRWKVEASASFRSFDADIVKLCGLAGAARGVY